MVIAAATTAVLPAHADAALHDRRRRPNIVFVLTDDMSLSDLAVMPATRQIGDEGATFDQFFINDPACCPSRQRSSPALRAQHRRVVERGRTGVRDRASPRHRGRHDRHPVAGGRLSHRAVRDVPQRLSERGAAAGHPAGLGHLGVAGRG
jgi:hypothetical protein